MKKSFLTFLVFIFSLLLFAQNENSNSFKPAKNNFSVEVDFMPFNLDKPINLNSFRGRFFLNEKMAIRVGFNFRNKNNYSESPADLNNDDVMMFNTIDEKFTVFGLSTGFEYHLLNSKRISPYIGIDIGYENKSSSSVYEDIIEEFNYPNGGYTYETRTTEYENSWGGLVYIYDPNNGYYYIHEGPVERAYTIFSVNAVLGADIYIIKHLYLGFEIGLGYNSKVDKEVEVKVDEKLENKYPKGKDNFTGLNVNNAIRLGVWF